MDATLTLTSGEATATIAFCGAELRAWHVGDVPLIWEPQVDVWPETAPILFPVVGWTRGSQVLVEGQAYPLGLHGFARRLAFQVREQRPDRVSLAATSSAETCALYPFDWELEVEHALDGPALTTRLTVRNQGAVPMPYACGLHPGLRWPFAGGVAEDYAVTFGDHEAAAVPVISPDGLFTRQTREVPLDDRHLPLSPALMAREALCFLDLKSRSLRYGHAASGAAIDVTLDDFPHVALWSRPPGRFLCIEPWTGHGDFVDADGDLHAKPSMRHLAPGAEASHAASFTYVAPRWVIAVQ